MADSADPDAGDSSDNAGANSNGQNSNLVTALRAPPKNLLSEPGPVIPVVVYTGPTRTAEQIAALAALPDYEPSKKKAKHKGAKTDEAKQTDGKPEAKKETKKDSKPAVKPAQRKPSSGKTTAKTTARTTTAQ